MNEQEMNAIAMNLTKSEVRETYNAKDFLIGTLIGGIVGSLTALLLAPKSGKELRGDFNNQAHLLREKSEQISVIQRLSKVMKSPPQ